MTASTQSRVLLENVQVKQSGTYLCEVTVTPGYYALMQFANMTVVGEFLSVRLSKDRWAAGVGKLPFIIQAVLSSLKHLT